MHFPLPPIPAQAGAIFPIRVNPCASEVRVVTQEASCTSWDLNSRITLAVWFTIVPLTYFPKEDNASVWELESSIAWRTTGVRVAVGICVATLAVELVFPELSRVLFLGISMRDSTHGSTFESKVYPRSKKQFSFAVCSDPGLPFSSIFGPIF